MVPSVISWIGVHETGSHSGISELQARSFLQTASVEPIIWNPSSQTNSQPVPNGNSLNKADVSIMRFCATLFAVELN
jgi:hypothetical protein